MVGQDRFRAVVAGVLALCAACTETVEVLSGTLPAAAWERCPEPLERGQAGDACTEAMGVCTEASGDGCCRRTVRCVFGRLDVRADCLPECGVRCTLDSQCPEGQAWCADGLCQPCREYPETCPPCPSGQVPLSRNGCRTCECAAPSACRRDEDCGEGGQCYAGNACGEGCAPGDVTCCGGNFCGLAGCPARSPMGCRLLGCPTGFRCDISGCAPSSCTCEADGTWHCTNDCVGGTCVPLR
jgi:hypothetical protein